MPTVAAAARRRDLRGGPCAAVPLVRMRQYGVVTLLLAVLVGLLVGAVMGALGGGGGIIAVPALVYLLGQSPVEATTTSLVVVGVTALITTVQYGRFGHVHLTDGLAFGILGVGGAVVGAQMSLAVDGDLLMALFAVLLVAVSWLMWGRADRQPEADLSYRWLQLWPFRIDTRRALLVVLAASAIGWLTGFFGVGGGFAIVPVLTMLLKLPLRRAVGTSLLVLALTSLVGLFTRASGSVELDWGVIGAFTVAAVLASAAAGRFSRRVNPRRLSKAFAVFLLVVAAYTAVNSALSLVG